MESTINSAIHRGFFQQIRYLLNFGSDPNVRDCEKRTPLINCALVEDECWGVGIARMLIEYGACISLKDKRGLNAFHYACIYERVTLVQVYLSAIDFDLNGTDSHGNTPLHHVVTTGNEELLRTLLDGLNRYKLTVDKPNKKGITSLIHAYKTHNISCGDLLIELGKADPDIKDPVEQKTAHEWKEQALVAMEELGASVKRPRTAFARLQLPRAPTPPSKNKRLTRVPSAPTLRKHGSVASLNEKENLEEEVLSRSKITAKLFRSASASDLRNKPEYILNVSPLEHFSKDNRYRLSTKHGHFVQQEDGSWRFEMKTLYKRFDFQFTNSYRKGAKPPDNGLLSLHRALSPNPSDYGGDSGRGLKGARRGSVKSPTSNDLGKKGRIGSANTRGRRSSLLSATSSKSQLTATDSSSNESVNSLSKRKNSETRDDLSEASSISSKSDKSKAPEPPRPVSRATHHPKEVPAANNNLAAIKE